MTKQNMLDMIWVNVFTSEFIRCKNENLSDRSSAITEADLAKNLARNYFEKLEYVEYYDGDDG